MKLVRSAVLTNAILMTFASAAFAAPATQTGISIPVRVTDIKVAVAPAGSPTGVGAARAFAKITALVLFCRGVAPEQFTVKVRKATTVQSIEILDVQRIDCRSRGTIQEVVLHTNEIEAYKPVVIKNRYLVDYGR